MYINVSKHRFVHYKSELMHLNVDLTVLNSKLIDLNADEWI